MKSRVHNSPNLIYSVGTQVVALKAVMGSNGRPVHPAGAVGVVVRSPYINELVERKLAGPEKGRLDVADTEFYEREYERLVAELEAAMEKSTLPEQASGKAALNDLLVRLRSKGR